MPPRASSIPQPCPAVSPDHTNEIERRSAGAVRKRPVMASLENGRLRQIGKPDAIENVLPRRQALEQRLGGEIALRQRIDEYAAKDVLEAVGGRDLDQHAGRPVGPRPDHAGIDRHVARLDAVGDNRAIRGAAEIRARDAADHRGRARRRQQPASAQNPNRHDRLRSLAGHRLHRRADSMPSIQRQFHDIGTVDRADSGTARSRRGFDALT